MTATHKTWMTVSGPSPDPLNHLTFILPAAFEDGDDSDESEYIENVEEGRDTTGDGAFAELEDLADGLPVDDEEDAFE